MNIIKTIIEFGSNKYLKSMIFGFMLLVIAIEYLDSILIKILCIVIAFCIALEPLIKQEVNN